jgi:3'-phosphoadenosine 5'-phosphosulfate sulfotransferase (PAPS reductase)/FAD synthetase
MAAGTYGPRMNMKQLVAGKSFTSPSRQERRGRGSSGSGGLSDGVADTPMTLDYKIAEANAILDEAVRQFDPSHMFALFSGGHDSLCASHVASLHPNFSGAAHINTTIGIEETRQFVRDTCKSLGWRLDEYYPPVSYRDIVRKEGFPGPGAHRFMYIRLKERCLNQLIRENKVKRHDRILLVTGVRAQESKRRMGHVVPINQEGVRVWVAPIINWSSEDKWNYIERYGLKQNPVVNKLCMSGECLCGAFARPGELTEIRESFPDTAAYIEQLQVEAAAAGVHAKWGTRPPGKRKQKSDMTGTMCWSCDAKSEGPETTSCIS